MAFIVLLDVMQIFHTYITLLKYMRKYVGNVFTIMHVLTRCFTDTSFSCMYDDLF